MPPSDTASARITPPARPVETRERRSLPYGAFLSEFVATGTPVVVRDSIPDWPARERWRPGYFAQRFGDRMVQVAYDRSMTFTDFVAGVEASTVDAPGPYMYRLFLHEHLPEVLPDVYPQNAYAYPRWFASPLMPEYWRRPDGYQKLLIGGVGGRFPVMHYDTEGVHATITQVYGDKEFVLFAPSDTPYMYAKSDTPNHSRIDDPVNQDRVSFPLLERATLYRTVLEPGDMIFVPHGWWHAARALSVSISIGTNILDGSNWSAFVRDVCSADPAPRRWAKTLYLHALGAGLGAMDAIQRMSPAAGKALRFPVRLAPPSSAEARDPALAPLRIRYATR